MALIVCTVVTLILFVFFALDVFGVLSKRFNNVLVII